MLLTFGELAFFEVIARWLLRSFRTAFFVGACRARLRWRTRTRGTAQRESTTLRRNTLDIDVALLEISIGKNFERIRTYIVIEGEFVVGEEKANALLHFLQLLLKRSDC
jgi:hypothetical protein